MSGIPPEIKLAYIPYSADLPFFVAMDKGYFTKRGLNITPIKCKNSSEALDLVLANKAVGAMGNSFSVLFSIQAKNSNIIKLINVSTETEELDRFTGFILVKSDSELKGVKNLKNKKIGTGKGASQLLWVQLYLMNLGLDPKKDVFIEQEGSESLLDALHSGQLDAIFIFEPYASIGISKGIAKILAPFFRKSIINPFPAGGATISKEFYKKYPKAANLLIEALDEAIELINSNPEEAKLSLINYTPLEKEFALKSQIYYWWTSKDVKHEPIQKLADILTDNKLLKTEINIQQMVVN